MLVREVFWGERERVMRGGEGEEERGDRGGRKGGVMGIRGDSWGVDGGEGERTEVD